MGASLIRCYYAAHLSSSTQRDLMRKSEGCWCQGGPLWPAETLCFTYPLGALLDRELEQVEEAVESGHPGIIVAARLDVQLGARYGASEALECGSERVAQDFR
jgi:hypothetical protein